ncbi:uncharacterized protein LOC105692215 [Athalia rosae]|uniref:uncharacterized protein LOC105692215 n=1 Tax=Athalia rosae TaxID=37344 RepID=UPI0020337E4B|nr:uncharacterized protein LOC105692215 [Athalia rosae]
MATMNRGVVKRANTIEENKQVLSGLIGKNKFVDPNQDELTELFTKLNVKNARQFARYVQSYESAGHSKKVTDHIYGPIPGFPSGSWWGIRMDCSRDRIHDPFSANVQCGPVGAVSICTSRTLEDVDLGDAFTFTGKPCAEENRHPAHVVGDGNQNQENECLILSYKNKVPVRVIRSCNLSNVYSPKTGYRYDGLYLVVDYWIGISPDNKTRCYKFAFRRLKYQDPPPWEFRAGGHNMPLPVMNHVQLNTDNANKNVTSKFRKLRLRGNIRTHGADRSCGACSHGNLPEIDKSDLEARAGRRVVKNKVQLQPLATSSPQETMHTMVLAPFGTKMVAPEHKNVHLSAIVTRRVSKKQQNNIFNKKFGFDGVTNMGGDSHVRTNEIREGEGITSLGMTRLQNTNISIRTDLYDSSHNLKDRVKKHGSNVSHSGIFKGRAIGIPRRQLHFAGVDSSPGGSRPICSVKMERVTSLLSQKEQNPRNIHEERTTNPLKTTETKSVCASSSENVDMEKCSEQRTEINAAAVPLSFEKFEVTHSRSVQKNYTRETEPDSETLKILQNRHMDETEHTYASAPLENRLQYEQGDDGNSSDLTMDGVSSDDDSEIIEKQPSPRIEISEDSGSETPASIGDADEVYSYCRSRRRNKTRNEKNKSRKQNDYSVQKDSYTPRRTTDHIFLFGESPIPSAKEAELDSSPIQTRENYEESIPVTKEAENPAQRATSPADLGPSHSSRDSLVSLPSDSPPFKGFESASQAFSRIPNLMSEVAILNTMSPESLLEMITEEKTSSMGKMLINNVIGIPAISSYSPFENWNVRTSCETETPASASKDSQDCVQPAEFLTCEDSTLHRTIPQDEFGPRAISPIIARSKSLKNLFSITTKSPEQVGGSATSLASASKEKEEPQNILTSKVSSVSKVSASHSTQSNSYLRKSRPRSLKLFENSMEQEVVEFVHMGNEQENEELVNTNCAPRMIASPDVDPNCTTILLSTESQSVQENREAVDDWENTNVIPSPRDEVDHSCTSAKQISEIGVSNVVDDIGSRSTLIESVSQKNHKTIDELLIDKTAFNDCVVNRQKVMRVITNNAMNSESENEVPTVSPSTNLSTEGVVNFVTHQADRKSEKSSHHLVKDKPLKKKRLVKGSGVSRHYKHEIKNLVIDMNMSPRSKRTSLRLLQGGDYLRRRSSAAVVERLRKRSTDDPVKHPTSPSKRLKKSVTMKSSPIPMAQNTSSVRELRLKMGPGNRGSLSNNNNNNINDNRNNNSMKRIGRPEKITTKLKKPMKLVVAKTNRMNGRRAGGEMPKIIRKRDSRGLTKQSEKVVVTRSGRYTTKNISVSRMGLRRKNLLSAETYARKKMQQKETVKQIKKQNQALSNRKPRNDIPDKGNYNVMKSPEAKKKPRMVSVMTQCSLLPEMSRFSPLWVGDSSRSAIVVGNSGTEYVCSSQNSTREQMKNESIDVIEIKSEDSNDDVAAWEDDDDDELGEDSDVSEEIPVNTNATWNQAFGKFSKLRQTEVPQISIPRGNSHSPMTSLPKIGSNFGFEMYKANTSATFEDQTSGDSVPKRGFIRYVGQRKRSSFVPVKPVEVSSRVAQLKSIGFKPIKPGVFPYDGKEDKWSYETQSSSDSPKIIYSNAVVKRSVHEEYDKYTSEETNVVQYMDSELSFEDIENEDLIFGKHENVESSSLIVEQMGFVKSDVDEESDANSELQESYRDEAKHKCEDERKESDKEWQSQLDDDSSSSGDSKKAVVESDGELPWHGWRKIVSNKKTYFVGW